MLADYPDRVIVTALSGVRSTAKGVHVIIYDSFALRGKHEGDLIHLVKGTEAQILILGRPARPDLQARAIELGGAGWVPMSIRAAELVLTIEELADGHRPDGVVAHYPPMGGLSAREVEVLVLIAKGLPNSAISERLFVTENTLKSHIRRIYKKIGAESRTQAVLWAGEQDLVDSA